jgi:hypothetical protein
MLCGTVWLMSVAGYAGASILSERQRVRWQPDRENQAPPVCWRRRRGLHLIILRNPYILRAWPQAQERQLVHAQRSVGAHTIGRRWPLLGWIWFGNYNCDANEF